MDAFGSMERMKNEDRHADLRRALAYALWRSVWRKHLKDLDACRMAAADQIKHLEISGYKIEPGPGVGGHGAVAGDMGEHLERDGDSKPL